MSPTRSFFRPLLLLAISTFLLASEGFAESKLSGVGSSAAYPVYQTWAEQYAQLTGTQISYEPAGSSAGLRKIRARESDFGASDVVPTDEDRKRHNLIVFPTVITGVVPVFNLPKIRDGQLIVSGELLAAIYSGVVTQWNDPMIRRLNPDITLPAMRIVPVVRADGSGTTYNFSDYLAKVSPPWKEKMGVGNSLKWPAHAAPAKGSKGVALAVQETVGSIGYVDYNYTLEYRLSNAQIRQENGALVEAKPTTFRNALMQSSWLKTGDFTQTLTNQTGHGAWPITMGTFVAMPRIASERERAKGIIRFFTWAFMNGDQLANQVNFIRLPDAIQAKAFRAMAEIRDSQGTPLGVGELGYRLAATP